MTHSTRKILIYVSFLCIHFATQSMSLGQVRNWRDGHFRQDLKNATDGITSEELQMAIADVTAPGIPEYNNYYTDFYKPFVRSFGCDPDTAATLASSIPSIQSAIKTALSSHITSDIQSALTGIFDYIYKGGSSFMFLPDARTLVTGASSLGAAGVAGAAAANMDSNILQVANLLQPFYSVALTANNAVLLPTLVQCATDLAAFLTNISSSSTPAANLGQWASSLVAKLSSSGSGASGAPSDADTAAAYALIDEQMATFDGSAPFAQTDVTTWGQSISGALQDLNEGYQTLASYAAGDTAIPNYTFQPNDYLNTNISALVTALQDAAGGASGASGDANFLTDPNLVNISFALSGINGQAGKKDMYYLTDATTGTMSVDPSKLSAMAQFAMDLKTSMSTWQGDPNDSASAADSTLCYANQSFANYSTAMNSAVADETDILGQLPNIFEQIGIALGVTAPLIYDTTKLPSYNIYGDSDINPNGLFQVMYDALANGPAPTSQDSYTFDNDQSVAALATSLANTIQNHNNMVKLIDGRCGAMTAAFSDPVDKQSPIKCINGDTVSVTGTQGTNTSRYVVQEVFHDIVNSDENGMLTLLNDQAALLHQQAIALRSAGATDDQFTTTDGMMISTISNFTADTVLAGTKSTPTISVTPGELTF